MLGLTQAAKRAESTRRTPVSLGGRGETHASPTRKSTDFALALSVALLIAGLLACKSERTEPTPPPEIPTPAQPTTQAQPVLNPQGIEPVAAATATATAAAAVTKKCAPNGATAPCDCAGGTFGMQFCDEKIGWSACSCAAAPKATAPKPAAPKPKAVVKKCAPSGATTVCECGNGQSGMQSCDEKIGWSKCSC